MALSLLDGTLIKNASIAIAKVIGLQTALDGKASTSHGHVIGDVTGLQAALDGKVAQSYVDTGLSAKANLASPDFTGNPTAPTQTAGNNSTRLATTAFVQAALTALGTLYKAGGTDVALADGGTGASLTDPNADRIMFWDESANAITWLSAGTNMEISGTQLNCTLTVPEAGGYTLLGTLNTNGAGSYTLSSLNLSSYRFLAFVFNGISISTTSDLTLGQSTADDVLVADLTATFAHTYTGTIMVELAAGITIQPSIWNNNNSTIAGAANTKTAITNSSTTVCVALSGAAVFDAGTVQIYGVK